MIESATTTPILISLLASAAAALIGVVAARNKGQEAKAAALEIEARSRQTETNVELLTTRIIGEFSAAQLKRDAQQQKRIDALSQRLMKAREAQAQFNVILTELKAHYEAEISSLKQLITRLKDDLARYQKSYSLSEQQREALNEQISHLKQDVAELRSKISAVEAQLREERQRRAAAEVAKEDAENRLHQLQENMMNQYAEIEAKAAARQADVVDGLNRRIAELEACLTRRDKQIATLSADLAAARDLIREYESVFKKPTDKQETKNDG